MSAAGFTIEKYRQTRFWLVRDAAGEFVAVIVYKKGAVEIVRRLEAATKAKAKP